MWGVECVSWTQMKEASRTFHNGITHVPNLMGINIHMYIIPARGPRTVLCISLHVMCKCAQSVLITQNNQKMWGVECVSWTQMRKTSRTFHNGITHGPNLLRVNIHMCIIPARGPQTLLCISLKEMRKCAQSILTT